MQHLQALPTVSMITENSLTLDGEEHSLLLRGLDSLKDELKNGEHMEDCIEAVNKLIVKVGKAPVKKFKVIERDNDAR